jgi:Leucine-rich repeat (LRR) protein
MRSLKYLDLSFNKLKGKIPHGLGSITSLIELRLSSNHFSGGFPVSIETLPNLKTLLLDKNAIGGTLPSAIAKMPSLVTLRINENNLMSNLPDFTQAVFLEEAHLDANYFSGPLPTFGSKRLRSLYLGRNAFTGSIPQSFGDLPKLEDLNLQANHLIGTIPESISKLTALQQLDLSFNRLTGTIPDSFSGLMQLRELVLNDNRLTGSVPDIGSMKRIEIARLNNNLLSGNLKFPLAVGDLNYLKELSIQNNDLQGVIPGKLLSLFQTTINYCQLMYDVILSAEFICDLLLNTLTADCWGPSSQVDCPCCSACF